MTEREMIMTFTLALLAGAKSAWSLYNRDVESKRLFEKDRSWRSAKTSEDDHSRLNKIKRRMVLGYSVFLIVNVFVCGYFAVKILQRYGIF